MKVRNKLTILAGLVVAGFIFTTAWSLIGTSLQYGPTVYTDCETITSVQPIGHRTATTYYISGDKGSAVETPYGAPAPAVGQSWCFSSSTPRVFDVNPITHARTPL